MGLYRQLLTEQAEEQRRDKSLPKVRGLDSEVLARRVEGVKNRPGYAADLLMIHRLITRGPRNVGEGMRLGSLKDKYREE